MDVAPFDLTLTAPSVEENGTGFPLTREGLVEYVDFYAGAAERTHPYLSPYFADDLAGLPPAQIMTAEYDVLRDDGHRYGERLAAAGVPVTVVRWAGHLHGSHEMTALVPSAREWQERNEAFLRTHLHPGGLT